MPNVPTHGFEPVEVGSQDGVKLAEIQALDRLREPDEMADQLMLDAGMIHPRTKFNSSPLKNGGWKTSLSYWVSVTFQGRAVKLPDDISCFFTPKKQTHQC